MGFWAPRLTPGNLEKVKKLNKAGTGDGDGNEIVKVYRFKNEFRVKAKVIFIRHGESEWNIKSDKEKRD